jgi:tetratricopeptide (TPR) repeat protein
MRLRPTPQPDVLVAFDPDWPMELHAALAAISSLPLPRQELMAVRDSLTRWTAHPADRASMFRYHQEVQPQMRSYLLGLVNLRLGDTAAVSQQASELDRLAAHDAGLAKLLAHLVRGGLALANGDVPAATAQVDSFPKNPPFALIGALTPHAGAFSRFLRAQISEAQGRLVEAIAWYASFPTSNGIDIIYLAPGHLRQAEIYQRLGQREQAIEHYSRFAELWRNCDPDLRGMVIKAEQEIERLKAGR